MKTIRILLAEDEETNRGIMELQLSRLAGVVCDSAPDGREALRLFGQRRYDLAILDQYLPGFNGDELARLMLASDPNLVLLAVTADPDQAEPLRRAGFSKIFIKPLRRSELRETILEYTT